MDEIWTDDMREILGIKLHEGSSWKVIKKVRRHTYKYVTKKDIRTGTTVKKRNTYTYIKRATGGTTVKQRRKEEKIRIYEAKYVHLIKKNYSEDQSAEN